MAGKYFLKIVAMFLLVGVISIKVESANAANILFVHTWASSSHRTAIWPLAEELANRGHNITYIFTTTKYRLGSHPKVIELTPSKINQLHDNLISKVDINIRINKEQFKWLLNISNNRHKLCEAFYTSPEIMEWVEQPNLHFDLIMIDLCHGECAYGLVHKFKAKLIQFGPLIPPNMFDGLGFSPESSSIPDWVFHPRPEMTFLNRLVSTLLPLVSRYELLAHFDKLHPIISEGLNITNLPSLQEIEANTSLVLLNSYLFEDYPRALPPMFVSYSGLWCSKEKLKERKTLPLNIANFIDKSKGFFYISFGSVVVSSTMPVRMRNHFFNAFKRMPEYKFLWRWTGSVPEETPENALLLPWFPQHDVLAHPKIKGFMMQGGQPSTQEALCHAVPLIVTPIYVDQDHTAIRLDHIGAALLLDIDDINEKTLVQNFRQLLNETHQERFKEFSKQYMDRPLDPLENAVFWTEYVLRRDTSLLRPLGIKQSWWQRRLLDVYAFLLINLVIICAAVVYIFKTFVKFIFDKVVGNVKIKSN